MESFSYYGNNVYNIAKISLFFERDKCLADYLMETGVHRALLHQIKLKSPNTNVLPQACVRPENIVALRRSQSRNLLIVLRSPTDMIHTRRTIVRLPHGSQSNCMSTGIVSTHAYIFNRRACKSHNN